MGKRKPKTQEYETGATTVFVSNSSNHLAQHDKIDKYVEGGPPNCFICLLAPVKETVNHSSQENLCSSECATFCNLLGLPQKISLQNELRQFYVCSDCREKIKWSSELHVRIQNQSQSGEVDGDEESGVTFAEELESIKSFLEHELARFQFHNVLQKVESQSNLNVDGDVILLRAKIFYWMKGKAKHGLEKVDGGTHEGETSVAADIEDICGSLHCIMCFRRPKPGLSFGNLTPTETYHLSRLFDLSRKSQADLTNLTICCACQEHVGRLETLYQKLDEISVELVNVHDILKTLLLQSQSPSGEAQSGKSQRQQYTIHRSHQSESENVSKVMRIRLQLETEISSKPEPTQFQFEQCVTKEARRGNFSQAFSNSIHVNKEIPNVDQNAIVEISSYTNANVQSIPFHSFENLDSVSEEGNAPSAPDSDPDYCPLADAKDGDDEDDDDSLQYEDTYRNKVRNSNVNAFNNNNNSSNSAITPTDNSGLPVSTSDPQLLRKIRRPRKKGIPPFPCEYCKSTFMTRQSLKHHTIKFHTGEFKLRCDICQKGFMVQTHLDAHIRGHHKGIKDVLCPICSKPFAYRNNMLMHKAKHSGIRAFQCALCDKNYIARSALRKHEEAIHGSAKFMCELCGKELPSRHYLNIHVKAHQDREAGVKKRPGGKGTGLNRKVATIIPGQNSKFGVVEVNTEGVPEIDNDLTT